MIHGFMSSKGVGVLTLIEVYKLFLIFSQNLKTAPVCQKACLSVSCDLRCHVVSFIYDSIIPSRLLFFCVLIFYTFAFSVPAIWVPVGMRFQKNLFLADLIFLLQGIMLSDDYIKIIKDGLLQSARDMGMGRWRWIFQQDNDPKVR